MIDQSQSMDKAFQWYYWCPYCHTFSPELISCPWCDRGHDLYRCYALGKRGFLLPCPDCSHKFVCATCGIVDIHDYFKTSNNFDYAERR